MTYLLIQQIFIECLIHARQCGGYAVVDTSQGLRVDTYWGAVSIWLGLKAVDMGEITCRERGREETLGTPTFSGC